jgi:lysozyme family protein
MRKLDIKALTVTDVTTVYRVRYWDAVRGEFLPAGLDLAKFDFGVNSCPARAAKAQQSVVGAKVDGVVGPETVYQAKDKNGKETIKALCAKRLSFLHGLSTWATFGKGWASRVADVEAKAVAMWLRSTGAPNVSASSSSLRAIHVAAAGRRSNVSLSRWIVFPSRVKIIFAI